jgi:hypothetical protein
MRYPIAVTLSLLAACAVDESTVEQRLGDPLLEQLQALPGVTVTELPPRPDAREFQLLVTQPLDHFHAGGATFEQRVVLRSRGVALPTTLASTGYGLFGFTPRDNEVSALLAGNAITVEHRYFEGSVPSPADPSFLTIRQAAADHHHIVELLRPIYTGAWISTGASKGGMTSLYHRRFYPNDVAATVAYVAPNSFTTDDPRYGLFLDQVGTPECRQQIVDLQRVFLDRRAELLPMFEAEAADFGFTFEQVGGLDVAFEHAVQEFRFAFWQYFGSELCSDLPTASSPIEDAFLYLDGISGPGFLASDQSLVDFGAYYYQAAAQLGQYGPRSLERHIRSRLQHPGTYTVERYSTLPVGRFDLIAMPDVQLWLATRGERVMLIYGQNDPWSAGAFFLGAARDSVRYTVPGGTHSARITLLPQPQQDAARAMLARWAGVAAAAQLRAAAGGDDGDWVADHERRRPL